MPHTSLQICVGISAFDDKTKLSLIQFTIDGSVHNEKITDYNALSMKCLMAYMPHKIM